MVVNRESGHSIGNEGCGGDRTVRGGSSLIANKRQGARNSRMEWACEQEEMEEIDV